MNDDCRSNRLRWALAIVEFIVARKKKKQNERKKRRKKRNDRPDK